MPLIKRTEDQDIRFANIQTFSQDLDELIRRMKYMTDPTAFEVALNTLHHLIYTTYQEGEDDNLADKVNALYNNVQIMPNQN